MDHARYNYGGCKVLTNKQFELGRASHRTRRNGNIEHFQRVVSQKPLKLKDGYRVVDTTWLSLRIRPFKLGMVHSFMVLLNSPLHKDEVKERMARAFGDLEC